MRPSAPIRAAVLTLAAAGIASCGGGSGPTNTNTPAIAKTATASGDGQTAQVGTALALPLRVVVTENGAPKAGATVTWAAAGTGASVNPTQATTDAGGVAATTWTLGTTAGTETATATLSGATGSPVTFTATATAVPVPLIAMTATASGDAQADSVAATLPNPLRVLVTLSGAVQAGDTVTWATSGTGAAVNPVKAVTDASGIATTSWTLGQTASSQTATATLAGATGSPVSFSATATSGAATTMSLQSGNNQTGTVNTALANPLQVVARDQFANGVPAIMVHWQVASGSATLGADSSATVVTGIAQTTVTLGATPGPVSITATRAGLAGSPITFDVTATAAVVTDTVQIGDIFFKSARNGSQNPAVDTIPAGGRITWTWTGALSHSAQSTGTPAFTSSSTMSSGSYSLIFSTAGTYTYDCAVHGSQMTGTIVVQ